MKTNRPIHRPAIRFRYWSRKGYAAFASLGHQVTIGQLHLNVTERSLANGSFWRFIAEFRKSTQ